MSTRSLPAESPWRERRRGGRGWDQVLCPCREAARRRACLCQVALVGTEADQGAMRLHEVGPESSEGTCCWAAGPCASRGHLPLTSCLSFSLRPPVIAARSRLPQSGMQVLLRAGCWPRGDTGATAGLGACAGVCCSGRQASSWCHALLSSLSLFSQDLKFNSISKEINFNVPLYTV